MSEKKINLILADDHELFREGLKALLKRTILVDKVWEAGNGEQIMPLLEQHPDCDLVILDVEMPVMDGIKAARIIREQFPSVKILILSMHFNEEKIMEMHENEVNGYMLKNTSLQELKQALSLIRDGSDYFCPEVSAILFKNLLKKKPAPSVQLIRLSDREEEVLVLICKQHTSQEIAEKLYLSDNTVRKHRQNLLEKTGSKTSAGLVIYAIRANLIKLEDL